MRLAIIGLFFAVAMAHAESVWERPIWDNPPAKQDSAQPTASNLATPQSDTIKFSPNTFVDPRDSQSYKTVTVRGVTWLAENLNYEGERSLCYDNKPHCKNDGRLYIWRFARRACPPGTRFPTVKDWERVLGSDQFKQTLVKTGYRSFSGGYYDYGKNGYYWSAEETGDYANYAYYIKLKVGRWQQEAFYKDQANSVRCIVEDSKTGGSHTWGDQ